MTSGDRRLLGAFLRDRRLRLDPSAFGFPSARRRTPGLRREEVAARANVSVTWYTWLEQGRGGAPSAGALERLARALMLTEAEREHLFLIGLGRPPAARPHDDDGVTPRLQRVLDVLPCPAIVRTAAWDVVAWNRPATLILTDYAALPPTGRNVLRLMFLDPRVRAAQLDWEDVSRFVVATFRADTARAGLDVEALVAELRRESPEFEAAWIDNDVRTHGEGAKRLRHPIAGEIAFEFNAFSVDGRPDLSMVVYLPASEADAERVRMLTAAPV